MKIVAIAVTAAMFAFGAAQAAEPAGKPQVGAEVREVAAAAARTETAERVVYVCDRSDLTRRAFAREFGEVKFVSAEDVLNAREAWPAPRCMTEAEAVRLSVLTGR